MRLQDGQPLELGHQHLLRFSDLAHEVCGFVAWCDVRHRSHQSSSAHAAEHEHSERAAKGFEVAHGGLCLHPKGTLAASGFCLDGPLCDALKPELMLVRWELAPAIDRALVNAAYAGKLRLVVGVIRDCFGGLHGC